MVETQETPAGSVRADADEARRLVARLFRAANVPDDEADLVGEVLVSADVRGIRSHGVARVPYFLVRVRRGVIQPRPEFRFETGTPTTGLLDAGNGIGIVAADRAMTEAMAMAQEHGSGFVVVTNSSHFGYAGFWAERAIRTGMIGISMSNSGGRVAPTFGTDPILGTNPLSVAMPGGEEGTDFYLDMATSAVAVGKVETALREGRSLPPGWVASSGVPTLDENGVLSFDSPLMPLGGEGTDGGGHKGYGLALMVELLCGALGGSSLQSRIAGAGGESAAAMGHFMGAIRIDGFRPPGDFQSDMESTFDLIRGSGKTIGHDRIYIAGEPEAIAAAQHLEEGIAVGPAVLDQLDKWAEILDVEPLRR
jgi:LDH2 family malate/lactate/ureidoglycolate dehydrogenase